MTSRRDVDAFEARAGGYDRGWRGGLHHEIADRTAAVAVSLVPTPLRVLDVGCGTGYLLRTLAARYPSASELAGVDGLLTDSGFTTIVWRRLYAVIINAVTATADRETREIL